MKESNILVDIVAKNFLAREIVQNTVEQFMKESAILADYVVKNLLNRVISKNI